MCRRALAALVLAAALVAPGLAPAAEPAPGDAQGEREDRLAALRRQREAEVARRDRALLQFHTYGLPKYSLEVEAANREIERLDGEIAELEKGGAAPKAGR
jgi:hypothetical protein